MVTALTAIQTNILGAAIIELMHGELSDETVAAIDSLNRDDVPEPLNDLVGMMHGMSTMPELRQTVVAMLLNEIRLSSQEVLENKYWEHPDPRSSAWISMYAFLQHILEGSDPETSLRANIDAGILPEVEKAPAWAGPLIQHAQASSDDDKDLTLELLNILEKIIQKRKAELSK